MNTRGRHIPITQAQASDIEKAFDRCPEVLSAYLFGSTASGHARDDSDVDIAVRLGPGLSAEREFQIRLELIDRLEAILDRPVDVVLMNDAALVMIHQVLSFGVPLFVRHPGEEERYHILKLKAYFDFRYYLDKDLDQMKRYFGATGHD